jgi:hypothetical protein
MVVSRKGLCKQNSRAAFQKAAVAFKSIFDADFMIYWPEIGFD